MQKKRWKFLLFIAIWLIILDYLVVNNITLNNSLFVMLGKPFAYLMENITGPLQGNLILTLIIINVIVAMLFSMSYKNWESKNKTLNKK